MDLGSEFKKKVRVIFDKEPQVVDLIIIPDDEIEKKEILKEDSKYDVYDKKIEIKIEKEVDDLIGVKLSL